MLTLNRQKFNISELIIKVKFDIPKHRFGPISVMMYSVRIQDNKINL